MSSILNALKKLEHEKKNRISESLHIDSDILKPSHTSPRFSSLSIGLLLLIVFSGGIFVTYFFMKESNGTKTTSQAHRVNSVQIIQPEVTTPLIKTETPPEEIIVVPARTETPVPLSRKQQPKTVAVDNNMKISVKKPLITASPTIIDKVKKTDDLVKSTDTAGSTPTVRVNGIAFQSNNADSVAIVNGVQVSKGSVIEGNTVEEVQKDKVLFQRNGEKFEVPLGQSK